MLDHETSVNGQAKKMPQTTLKNSKLTDSIINLKIVGSF